MSALIEPMDAGFARRAGALLERCEPWNKHPKTIREVLAAIEQGDAEHLGLVATDGSELAGFVLYHMVAGAEGTAAITAVVAKGDDIVAQLLIAALEKLPPTARLVVAEFPGGDGFGTYRKMLVAEHFERVAEVSDYYGDGVPLVIMRTEIGG